MPCGASAGSAPGHADLAPPSPRSPIIEKRLFRPAMARRPGTGVLRCSQRGADRLPRAAKARIAPLPARSGAGYFARRGWPGTPCLCRRRHYSMQSGMVARTALRHDTPFTPDTAVHTGAPWFRRGCGSRNCRPRRRWPRKKRHQK
nr:hypothetical protein RVX_0951 [Nitratidesulfovibrio sp. HK-II]